jgi:hypothetical protein
MNRFSQLTSSIFEVFSTQHPNLVQLDAFNEYLQTWEVFLQKQSKTSSGQPSSGILSKLKDLFIRARSSATGKGSPSTPTLDSITPQGWESFWNEFNTFWQKQTQAHASSAKIANINKLKSALRALFTQLQSSQAQLATNAYFLALRNSDCSASTLKNYRSDINQFLRFANETQLSQLMAKPKVAKFLENEQAKGLTESSIRRKRTSISLFATWAIQNNWLQAVENLEDLPNPDYKPGAVVAVNAAATTNNQALVITDAGKTADVTSSADSSPNAKPATATPLTSQNKPVAKPASTATTLRTGANGLQAIRTTLRNTLKASNTILPIFNLGLLVLFLMGLTWFGYRQFTLETPEIAAFPADLTRPSRVLSFQGRLTDTVQNPITVPTNMVFRLYDALTGGNLLWNSGSCSITPDQDGIFSSGLGSDCGSEINSDVFSENVAVYLEVQVGSETLTPRQPIRTVAYAINTETLQGFPPADPAVASSVLVLDEFGDLNIGSTSPTINATTGTFTIEGQALVLQTATSSDGDITLSPDGTGGVIINSDLDVQGSVRLGAAGVNNVLNTSAAAGSATGSLYWGNEELLTSASLSSYGVSSVTGTTNQITASPTTGAVVLSLPTDLRAPGTFNATTSIATGTGAGTVRIDASGNLTNIGTITASGNTTIGGTLGVTGAITASNLNAGGIVKANATTGELVLATAGTDFENPLTFSNGLTRTSNSVALGGTLSANTSINLNSFNLAITGAGNFGIGTASPITKLHVSGATVGKALAIFNETGDQDLLVASASGNVRFRVDTNGYTHSQRFVDLANSAYFLDPAATGVSLAIAGSMEITNIETITNTRLGRFADGSASTPAYSFSSETNSGMYRVGASQLGWSINGNQRMLLSNTTLSLPSITTLTASNLSTLTTASTLSMNMSTLTASNLSTLTTASTLSMNMSTLTASNLSTLTTASTLSMNMSTLTASNLGTLTTASTLSMNMSTLTASNLSTLTTASTLSMNSTTTLALGTNADITLGASTGGSIAGSTASNGNLLLQGTTNANRTSSILYLQPYGGQVEIANGTTGGTVSIGTANNTQTISIGTGSTSTTKTINIGSTGGANSVTNIRAGTTGLINFTVGSTLSVQINQWGIRLSNDTADGAACQAGREGTLVYDQDPGISNGRLFLCRENSAGVFNWLVLDMSAGSPDLAEYAWTQDTSLEGGDIVAVSAQNRESNNYFDTFWIERASKNKIGTTLGIISTDPGIILNDPGKSVMGEATNPHLKPLTLAGRVLVKTVVDQAIQVGDRIGLSDIDGIGTVLTSSGMSVGTSLTNFDPATAQCTPVSGIDAVPWLSSNFNSCFTLPDGKIARRILVLVNTQYYHHNMQIAADGQIIQDQLSQLTTSFETQLSELVDKIDSLSFNTTGELKNVQRISNNGDSIAIELGNSAESQLQILNESMQPVASIDSLGNAQFTGTVTATRSMLGELITQDATVSGMLDANEAVIESAQIESARIVNLEAQLAQLAQIKAQNAELMTATISGTLYATQIDGFQEKVELALKEPSLIEKIFPTSTNWNYTGFANQYFEDAFSEESFDTLLSSLELTADSLRKSVEDLNLSDSSVVLGAEAAYINQHFQVQNSAYVGQSLGVGGTFIADGFAVIGQSATIKQHLHVGESLNVKSNIHADGTISAGGTFIGNGFISYNQTQANGGVGGVTLFEIQPSGIGTLSFMAGLFTLDESGDVHINGNLTLAGSLSVVNNQGESVARITETGQAMFSQGISVSQAAPNEQQAQDKTAGVATITKGTNEIVIRTTQVSDTSLIYVTPLGSTNNQVLFVKEKITYSPDATESENQTGTFTVAIEEAIDQDIAFNWWIIN